MRANLGVAKAGKLALLYRQLNSYMYYFGFKQKVRNQNFLFKLAQEFF